MTGVKEADAEAIAAPVSQVREAGGLPVAVGFGIRTAERAAAVARVADAVVVGSALVDEIKNSLPHHATACVKVLAKTKGIGRSCTFCARLSIRSNLKNGYGGLEQQRPQTAPGPQARRAPRARGLAGQIAPGVSKLVSKRETPENLWVKDPDTGDMIYRSDLEAKLWVTPSGRHMRIGAEQRMKYTFDDGAWEDLATPDVPEDPLHFSDGKPYKERLKAARAATGDKDVMSIGYGQVQGVACIVLVQDFAFMGGSLGMAAGEGFIAARPRRHRAQMSAVIFTAAGGARMQEGALSLMQMARTTLAIQELKGGATALYRGPHRPDHRRVTASYAMLGDIHLAEPGALICFAGPRVIETTIREKLPEGFQRAEFLVEKGMVDRVVPRDELPEVLGALMSMLMGGRRRAA